MASSKILFLLCVLFALVLLVSSEATSSDVHTNQANGLKERKDGGGSYGVPGNGGGSYGGGSYGAPGYGGNGGSYGGGGCQYGCCRYYSNIYGCSRCCQQANDAPDAFFADDVKN
ncbi:hypothetical protein Ddye_016197 [Dipteronia dyeriana]|uniref:Glycine-rich protein n=1 Tax=Dipteronia dyeriana TaxID=168575 RepID=A0AAD9WZW2_9ROSI|nr:hypothetical protein Ddye_016197 [Dipteronia dyeriana]